MNGRICLDSPSNDNLEFQTQKFHADGYWTSNSIPYWMSRSSTDSDNEASHLLSNDCSTSSPPSSRYRAIEDGRKVLMDLMENMPESSYELTLRDIVDEQQNLEKEARKETMIADKPLVHKPYEVNSKKDKTVITSMNSRVFLLKIFIPVPLALKAKAVKKRSSSRIISSPSFDGSEKLMAKDRCKKRMAFSEKRDRKKCDSISKGRDVETTYVSCWQLFSRTSSKRRPKDSCLMDN